MFINSSKIGDEGSCSENKKNKIKTHFMVSLERYRDYRMVTLSIVFLW